MISWIQVTFEKHTKAFLAFLLIVITIPFVFFTSGSGFGRSERRIQKREFFGTNIASQAERSRIDQDAQISVMLRVGYRMPMSAQLDEYALQRTASLALADSYHLPQPTADELKKSLGTYRAFQNEQGEFDAVQYNKLRDQLKTGGDLSEADVVRVLRDEYRLQRLNDLLSGPGYAAPYELVKQLAAGNTKWTIKVAAFDLADYSPGLKPSDDDLRKYFDDNASNFLIQERANVDYVTFSATDFAGDVVISDDEVVAYFEANKFRFTPPAEQGKPAAEPTLAAAKPEVLAALRTERAGRLAATAASDFAVALYEQKLAMDAPAVPEIVAKYRGHRATAPLFTRDGTPAGLNWPKEIVAAAFALDKTRWYSDAYASGTDQVVLLWRETLPVYQPKFEETRDQVLAAYLENQKSSLLQANGALWKSTIKSKVASGTEFEAAVAGLTAAPKSEVKSYGPFTLRQPAEGLPGPVTNIIERAAAGEISDMVIDNKKAYIVQILTKEVPTVDTASLEYTNAAKGLAANAANLSRNLVIDELVKNELARGDK
jgi:peptidyl-prolyl cis-trans isomerase D